MRGLSFPSDEKRKAEMKVLVTRSCPTLCNPLDCSPQIFSYPGILQARILEWVVAIPFPRGLPNIEHKCPALQADSLLSEPPRKLSLS